MSADACVWCGSMLMLAGVATLAKLAEQRGRRRRYTIRYASRPDEIREFWR